MDNYFDGLTVYYDSSSAPIRDTCGLLFPEGSDIENGEYAYLFLAKLNGMAKQMAKEGREDFHVACEVGYKDSYLGNMQLDLGSKRFQGKETVADAILEYAQSGGNPPLPQQYLDDFKTLKKKEQSCFKDAYVGEIARALNDGKTFIYPYMEQRAMDFMFDAYHSEAGQNALLEAWNILHPLPDEEFIAATQKERKNLFFDFPNLHEIQMDTAPYVWINDDGVACSGDFHEAVGQTKMGDITDALLRGKLPEDSLLSMKFQEQCSDESIIRKCAAKTVLDCLKAHDSVHLRDCAETLCWNSMNELKHRVLLHVQRPEDFDDLNPIIEKVITRQNMVAPPKVHRKDHELAPYYKRTPWGKVIQSFWERHPKEAGKSVGDLLSVDGDVRKNILNRMNCDFEKNRSCQLR